MAHRSFITLGGYNDEGTASRFRFYNVTRAVGHGCPNRPDDVMLVQYFVDFILFSDQFLPGFYRDLRPNPRLRIDGACGPRTREWIRKYQERARRRLNQILVDGRVDPANDFYGTQAHLFTIINLNREYKERYPSAFADLRMAAYVPALLAQSLGEGPDMNTGA